MKKPLVALRCNISIGARAVRKTFIIDKMGAARIGSAFLIFALLTQPFFAGPIRAIKSDGRGSGSILISHPVEPFYVHNSTPRVLDLSALATSSVSAVTNLFTKREIHEDFELPKPPSFAARLASTLSSKLAFLAPKVRPSVPRANNPSSSVSMASRVAFNFDDDNKADIGRWHPTNHTFEVKPSNGGANITTSIGTPASIPVPGDYDGDGKTDVAVFTSGAWQIIRSRDGNIQF